MHAKTSLTHTGQSELHFKKFIIDPLKHSTSDVFITSELKRCESVHLTVNDR